MPSDVFGLDVVYDRQVDSNWPESSNYGYFAGGSTPPPSYVCTIDRLDFSSETVSEPSSELTQARSGLISVSNSLSRFCVQYSLCTGVLCIQDMSALPLCSGPYSWPSHP